MFKTNTAREIFYIFLWLAGIILLYTIVFTFVLEPSQGKHEVTHAKYAVTDKEENHKTVNVTKPHTETTQKTHVVQANNTEKVIGSHNIKKITPSVVESVITDNVPKHIKHVEKEVTTTVEPLTKKEVTKPVNTPTAIKEKHVDPTIQTVITSPTKVISTPSVPTAVSMPKSTISIPSTPSVPSVPTMPNSSKITVEKTTIQKNTVKVDDVVPSTETDIQMKKLEKVLSQDEEMKVIETARQHVIDTAESSREEAMKALKR